MAGIVLVGAIAIVLAGFGVGMMLATAYFARRRHRTSRVSQADGAPWSLAGTGAGREFVVRPP